MASKMAVSQAPKTYMTNILDQKHFFLTFHGCFRGYMLQPITMEHYFDSDAWNIKDGVQDGRQLGF